jgi:predicted tellurium resistance membrane protein TerC
MDTIFTLTNLLNLTTLTGLEIILGIDNVIFIALIVQHLPPSDRGKARLMGLSLAIILRIAMLLGVSWIISLKEPFFTLLGFPFSGRSLMLLAGGAFLIIKPIIELVEMFKEAGHPHQHVATPTEKKKTMFSVIVQIIFIDLVLSFDSVITAVGMTNNIPIIIVAIFIAMAVMLLSAKPISDFIAAYPSIKVIALAFIMLVGVVLVAAGFDVEIDKTYLYFSMFFSLGIEVTNILLHKKRSKAAALTA